MVYCTLNPMAPVIDSYRRVILYGQAPQWQYFRARARRWHCFVLRRWAAPLQETRNRNCRPHLTDTSVSNASWKRFRADRQRPELAEQLRPAHGADQSIATHGGGCCATSTSKSSPATPSASSGINGAGKSTLLKILTQVMYPTSGKVDLTGKVGALIELRGGMHPDLTGRENALLYGSLMGIGRKEVVRRFDDIVDFAQLAGAIDRQVKFFSSGMQMRLGFAIAAFMNPGRPAGRRGAGRRRRLVPAALPRPDAGRAATGHDPGAGLPRPGVRRGDVPTGALDPATACSTPTDPSATCSPGTASRSRSSPFENISHGGIVRVVQVERQQIRQSHAGVTRVRSTSSLLLQTFERERGRLYVGVSEGPGTPTFLVSTEIILEEGDTTVRCQSTTSRSPVAATSSGSAWSPSTTAKLIPWHPAATFEVFGSDLD